MSGGSVNIKPVISPSIKAGYNVDEMGYNVVKVGLFLDMKLVVGYVIASKANTSSTIL